LAGWATVSGDGQVTELIAGERGVELHVIEQGI